MGFDHHLGYRRGVDPGRCDVGIRGIPAQPDELYGGFHFEGAVGPFGPVHQAHAAGTDNGHLFILKGDQIINTAAKTYGSVDIAFNNAGIQSPAVETADVGSEVFDQVNAINRSSPCKIHTSLIALTSVRSSSRSFPDD